MDRFRLPLPSRDEALFRETREAGFAAYPLRKENYLRFRAAVRGERVDYLPVHLDVENVSRCNFRCRMCQAGEWGASGRAPDMSLEDFVRILDAQSGLVEVKIQGMGEPLLQGKVFFGMVREARRRFLWVRSTTNASLLHVNDNYRKVIDCGICELQVSVDGASAESYEEIRRGGRFATVRENCRLLNAYAASTGRRRTRMWSLIQARHLGELEAFPPLARELGFDRLTLSVNLGGWGRGEWEERNRRHALPEGLCPPAARRLVDIGREHGVDVTFWGVAGKYDSSSPSTLCPIPFERVYVTSDLRIVPCAGVGNPAVVDYGCAHDLADLWNGPGLRGLRRTHLEGAIPYFCRACYADSKEDIR